MQIGVTRRNRRICTYQNIEIRQKAFHHMPYTFLATAA